MTEIILVIIIFLLLVYIGVKEYLDRKERKTMINALMAKNAPELTNLEWAQNTKVNLKEQESEPDLVPLDSVSDKEFSKVIEDEIA